MTTTVHEIRHRARLLKVPWGDVRVAYNDVKEHERLKRARANQVRETAWCYATTNTPRAWPFWRHGFSGRYARRVDAHDYTIIPGYDELHQQIAHEFPEWDGENGIERLWDFLLSPYDKMPPVIELYERALDLVADVSDEFLPANDVDF